MMGQGVFSWSLPKIYIQRELGEDIHLAHVSIAVFLGGLYICN